MRFRLKRTTDFIPLRIYELHSVLQLRFARSTQPRRNHSKKIHDQKINGSKATCVEIAGHNTREVCVDKVTGALVRRTPYLDRETVAVAGKLFPRFLSYVEQGKPLVEVQVTELKTPELLPSSVFEPPSGAVSKPGCMHPSLGRLINKVTPKYPEAERQKYAEGTVAIYVLIAKDGVPQHLRIVSGSAPGFNKASLDAVEQWRYEPVRCNANPVDFETVITVNFSLAR